MAIVTPEEVKTLTGKTVTEDHVTQAAGMIELRTGVVEENLATLSWRDSRFLKSAVCYQAAWISDRPDTFDRDDVDSIGQDGVSASLKKWANTLAPNARLALKRLSWKGTRSTTTGTRDVDPEDDDLDRNGRPLHWKPIVR